MVNHPIDPWIFENTVDDTRLFYVVGKPNAMQFKVGNMRICFNRGKQGKYLRVLPANNMPIAMVVTFERDTQPSRQFRAIQVCYLPKEIALLPDFGTVEVYQLCERFDQNGIVRRAATFKIFKLVVRPG